MRSTQTSLVKKIASFLTATSIMCSVCGSNFSAFAEYFDNASRYKASIVDDTENGTVEFVANERYEDVYKEVPIENSEVGITVNENGELVQEVISDSDLTEEIMELCRDAWSFF